MGGAGLEPATSCLYGLLGGSPLVAASRESAASRPFSGANASPIRRYLRALLSTGFPFRSSD